MKQDDTFDSGLRLGHDSKAHHARVGMHEWVNTANGTEEDRKPSYGEWKDLRLSSTD